MTTPNRTSIMVMPGEPFLQILAEQLDGWYRVPSSWPSRRDLDAFYRGFERSFHSVVIDLSDDPLLREEL
jgi:hypothetical protein